MARILQKIYRIFAGIWLGTMVFFSGVIAPQIFKLLPKDDAASVQNHLFPFYYIVGTVCGFVLLGSDLFLGRKRIIWIALATTLAIVGFTILTPFIRDAYLTHSPDMKWLHPVAVFLNVVMLVCILIAV